MVKKYIVRLSEEERSFLRDIVKKLKGTSQKVQRANILLKADVDGPKSRRLFPVEHKPSRIFDAGSSPKASMPC